MCEGSQIDIPWLERQTGVQYQTLKKHYARWWPDEGRSGLLRFSENYPELFADAVSWPRFARDRGQFRKSPMISRAKKVEARGIEPARRVRQRRKK